jgi:hypothetical protein
LLNVQASIWWRLLFNYCDHESRQSKVKRYSYSVLEYLCNAPWNCIADQKYRSTILELGTGWVKQVFCSTHSPHYSRWNSLWYTLDRRLVAPRSGLNVTEKKSYPYRKCNPAIYPSLNRVHYPYFNICHCIILIWWAAVA